MYVFNLSDFYLSDGAGERLVEIEITSLHTDGHLRLDGRDIVENEVISAADIAAGKFSFVPAADRVGLRYDSFHFRVNDGSKFSSLPYTMSLDVRAMKERPTAANGRIRIEAGATIALSLDDFKFHNVRSDAQASIQITSLPGHATLRLRGIDVSLDQVIPAKDVAEGRLRLVAPADTHGEAPDSFQFGVNDGVLDSLNSYRMSIDIAKLPAPLAESPPPLVDEVPAEDEALAETLAASTDEGFAETQTAATDGGSPETPTADEGLAETQAASTDEGLAKTQTAAMDGGSPETPTADEGLAETATAVTSGGSPETQTAVPALVCKTAPTVEVQDQVAEVGDFVLLDVRAVDPDGETLTYQWEQIAGETVGLFNANRSSPFFSVPGDAEASSLQFQVSVSDGTNTVTRVVTVEVTGATSSVDPIDGSTRILDDAPLLDGASNEADAGEDVELDEADAGADIQLDEAIKLAKAIAALAPSVPARQGVQRRKWSVQPVPVPSGPETYALIYEALGQLIHERATLTRSDIRERWQLFLEGLPSLFRGYWRSTGRFRRVAACQPEEDEKGRNEDSHGHAP